MMIIKLIFLIVLFKFSYEQKRFGSLIEAINAQKGLKKATTNQVLPTTNQVVPTTNQVVPTNNQVVPTTNQVVPTTNQAGPATQRVVPTNITRNPNATLKTCGADKGCISFLHCDNGTAITDGNTLIDLRDDLNICNHYTQVCCALPNILKESKPIVITTPKATKCGVLNPNGVGMKIREIVDHEAQFGEFPWMVAVLKKVIILDDISSVYHCGGSLIHPSVVLTIGHKVDNESAEDLWARAGEWDTQTDQEPFPYVQSDIASIAVHSDFHQGTATNNIALLFLETPIENKEHINTICLPPPHMNFDGSRCFVTGWGKDNFEQHAAYAVFLKKIDLPVIGKEKCTEMFRKTRLGPHFQLHDSFICAGGEAGKDSCKGDGGSPLVCPVPGNDGYFFQAGIVAWGIGCGENNTPGAYTSVTFFSNWIENEMQVQGYNSSSYTF